MHTRIYDFVDKSEVFSYPIRFLQEIFNESCPAQYHGRNSLVIIKQNLFMWSIH